MANTWTSGAFAAKTIATGFFGNVKSKAEQVAGVVAEKTAPLAATAKTSAGKATTLLPTFDGPKATQMRGFLVGAMATERGSLKQYAPDGLWEDVFVVLADAQLKVFDSSESEVEATDEPGLPKSIIQLNTITKIEPSKEEENSFVLHSTSDDEQLIFQAATERDCKKWIGLLTGVHDACVVKSTAGNAMNTTGQTITNSAKAATKLATDLSKVNIASSSTGVAAHARGFFTTTKEAGTIRMMCKLPVESFRVAAPQSPSELDFANFGESDGESPPQRPRDENVEVYVVLSEGQLKIYKDEDDYDFMGSPEIIIDVMDITALGDCDTAGANSFEICVRGLSGRLPTSLDQPTPQEPDPFALSDDEDQPAQEPQPEARPVQPKNPAYVFHASSTQERAKWLGLLRGVWNSRFTKVKVLEGTTYVKGVMDGHQ